MSGVMHKKRLIWGVLGVQLNTYIRKLKVDRFYDW